MRNPNISERRPATWWLGQVLLYLGLWLSLVKLPGVPAISLDASWQMAIGYASTP